MAAANDTSLDALMVATKAANWILAQEAQENGGSYWPSRAGLSLEEKCDIYYGDSGVLLFLRELYQATGRKEYAEAIQRGVRFLAENVSRIKLYGLYDGLAGIAFALAQQPENPEAAAACSQALDRLIRESSAEENGGVRWNNYNDVMGGSAGIGLALLALGKQLHRPELIRLAVQAGTDLVANSNTASHGRYWLHKLDAERQYPNFSHGTAGVGYFLLKLYEQIGKRRFLSTARDAAEYLDSIASVAPATNCLIPHDLSDGKELFYLGWCHGPAGTDRFFDELFVISREAKWRELGEAAAETVLHSGIPEKRTPGYWNNVSRCCGAVAVGEFFLARYRRERSASDREFAIRIGKYLASNAQADADGLKWVQAETRIEPDKIMAQTGLMQGAAGVGLFFVHLADLDESEKAHLLFPDSPW
jgi:lantibiotic modifying enzyme